MPCSRHIKFPVNTSCHLGETIHVTLPGVITSKTLAFFNRAQCLELQIMNEYATYTSDMDDNDHQLIVLFLE